MSKNNASTRAGAALAVVVAAMAALTPAAAADSSIDEKIGRIENALLPVVLVKGESLQTTRLADRMNALRVPGVSVAVINDGEIEWARGFGVIRTGGPAVTAQTLFQAASISKPVSALAVMQLVQGGKLDLDADVNTYLKRWKLPDNELMREQKVTLRRLLSHTAGMTVHGFAGYASDQPLPTLQQILDGKSPANNDPIRVDRLPGTEWRYSGGGYVVMQQALEDVTGMPFDALLRDRVLEPLGMNDSSFQQPLPVPLLARSAMPYQRSGSAVPGGPHVYPELAPAGLWTTPSDLARYAIGVQRAWSQKPKSILSADSARAMLTPTLNRQGLGPIVGGSEQQGYFMHGGANAGYRCLLVSYLSGDGAIIMTNSDSGGELTGQILRTIAQAYGWPDFAPPERIQTSVDPTTFDRYGGAYRLAPQVVITLWRDGARMFSRVRGQPISELFPTSEREYFQKVLPARFEFAADATAMILHEDGQQRQATRVAPAESQALLDEAVTVGRRVREQRPFPHSDGHLRRLIAGLASGAPDYAEMTPDFADLTRQVMADIRAYLAPLGALRTITFRQVSEAGADIYDVQFENGSAEARIMIEPDGRIGSALIERR